MGESPQILLRVSVAWRSGLERRFYDNHDCKVDGSLPTRTWLTPNIARAQCIKSNVWTATNVILEKRSVSLSPGKENICKTSDL